MAVHGAASVSADMSKIGGRERGRRS